MHKTRNTTGKQKGEIVVISDCHFIDETGKNLTTIFEEWCNTNISIFQKIEELVSGDLTMCEIDKLLMESFNCSNGSDMVISFLKIRRPTRLFGTAGKRKYHGASQFPWYEHQLEKHRKKRRWWKIF